MFFAVLGAALIGAGVHFADATNRFSREASKADGTVVDIETSTDSDGDTMYYPVVEYVSGGDQLIRFRAGVGTSWQLYAVGDTVAVLYSPEDPESARIDAKMHLYFMPVVLWVVGGVFFVVGTATYIIFTFAMARRRRSAQ